MPDRLLDNYHGPAVIIQGEHLVDVHCTWQLSDETVAHGESMPGMKQWSGYFTVNPPSQLHPDDAELALRDGRLGRILIIDFSAATAFGRFQGLGDGPAMPA